MAERRIWVWTDVAEGAPHRLALELLVPARKLGTVEAVVLHPEAGGAAGALGAHGAAGGGGGGGGAGGGNPPGAPGGAPGAADAGGVPAPVFFPRPLFGAPGGDAGRDDRGGIARSDLLPEHLFGARCRRPVGRAIGCRRDRECRGHRVRG